MVGVWLERGLYLCVWLLPPLLALLPHAAAPLAGVAGLCAAGLTAARPPYRLAALRWPAGLLLALLVWGSLSTAWSIGPWRSCVMEVRLAGLFVAALALAAAAGRVAAPMRLALAALAAMAIAIVLALTDLASAGALHHLVSVRAFGGPSLNQLAIWLVILLPPVTALLLCASRRLLAITVAAALAGTVLLLDDTTAKVALGLSVPAAALAYLRPRALARIAAALSLVAILTAPLTLPRLERIPGLFAAADRFKTSAGHRLLIWSFVGDHIAERPLAGWGLDAARAIPGGDREIRPGQNWLPLHPHNAALQVWLELGAPGAALFALLVAWLWLRLAEAAWPRAFAAAAAGSLAAALAAASSGWGIWEEWWLAALAMALFAVLVMARAAAAAQAAATPPPRRGWRGAGR